MIKENTILNKKIDGGINIDKVKSLSVRVIEGDSALGNIKVKYIFDEYTPQEKYAIINICSTKKEYQETDIHVINDTNNFINGYKVVELSNHKFGYVKEETNELMLFYYDVALNFNNYGLAMVGKRSSVSWINKKFEFVSSYGEFYGILTPTKEAIFEFLNSGMAHNSFSRICNFGDNEVPLSMVSASHISNNYFPPIKILHSIVLHT